MRFFSFFLIACAAWGATVSATYLASLPVGVNPHAIGVDANGYVFLVGDRTSGPATTAFVAKLSANGSQVQFYEEPGASGYSTAAALAIGADGAVYVTGTTTSADFPTTDASLLGAGKSNAFVWKINSDGTTAYSVLLGGDAMTSGLGIAVNKSGGAFVTGPSTGAGFPVSIGGLQSASSATSFVVRLDNAGVSQVYAVTGPGGQNIAVDAGNYAYIAGSTPDPASVPATSGAYQPAAPSGCVAGPFFTCLYQYVCKIDPSGTELLFCSFVTGSQGTSNSAIALDGKGNILLAGLGKSDYPVTPDALIGTSNGPYSGVLSKLSNDGSQLLYSTFLGGKAPDQATGLALDPMGDILLATTLQSSDFPNLPVLPSRCSPQINRPVPALLSLSPDAHSIQSLTLIEEAAPCLQCTLLTVNQDGKAILAGTGPWLASYDPNATPKTDAIACVTDSADYAHAGPIAPGELVTIFGSGMANASLLLNGVSTPPLYSSDSQINFLLPVGTVATSVRLDLTAAGKTIGSRTLPVAPAAPSLLLGPSDGVAACGSTPVAGTQALTLNADGSLNACDHPAAPGSVITVYVNGAGATTKPVVTETSGLKVVNVTPLSGLWAVQLQVPAVIAPVLNLNLIVQGAPVREQSAVVWVSSH